MLTVSHWALKKHKNQNKNKKQNHVTIEIERKKIAHEFQIKDGSGTMVSSQGRQQALFILFIFLIFCFFTGKKRGIGIGEKKGRQQPC